MRMIDDEIKMMRQEFTRLSHEREQMAEKISDNTVKVKQNKVLPYLVSKVVEVRRFSLSVSKEKRLMRVGFRYWMWIVRHKKARHTTSKTPRRASVL